MGIRFRCFEEATRARGVETFDLFLSTLLESGDLPGGLVLVGRLAEAGVTLAAMGLGALLARGVRRAG